MFVSLGSAWNESQRPFPVRMRLTEASESECEVTGSRYRTASTSGRSVVFRSATWPAYCTSDSSLNGKLNLRLTSIVYRPV